MLHLISDVGFLAFGTTAIFSIVDSARDNWYQAMAALQFDARARCEGSVPLTTVFSRSKSAGSPAPKVLITA